MPYGINDSPFRQMLRSERDRKRELDPFSIINSIDPDVVDPEIVSGAQLTPYDKLRSLDFMPSIKSPFDLMGSNIRSPYNQLGANQAGIFQFLMNLARMRNVQ